jgi:hypothetical protein
MLRTGLFVLLAAALASCSSATTAPSTSQAAVVNSEAASIEPTAESTPELTAEPTPEPPRAAKDYIVTAADVPSEWGALTGLALGPASREVEITPETLADWEEADAAAKIAGEGFVSGYIANFGYANSDLYSAAYVFDNPAGALAYQVDAAAGLVGSGCTDVSDTLAMIGDASSALQCPTLGPVEPTAWIIFATGNAVVTVRIKALIGESAPNLDGLSEIARNLEARVAS